MALGFIYDSDKMNYTQLIDATGDNAMDIKWTYKATDWMTMGVNKKWKSVLDPMSNVAWKCALVGNFEK